MRGLLHSPPFVWFICARMWGHGVLPAALPAPLSATLSLALSVYLRKCGAAGSASGQTACPVHPTLRQSRSCHSHASPLSAPVPASAPPTGLDVCFFFIYLVSDLPAIRFSVSSGCERRRSVSTYAAILVLSHEFLICIPFILPLMLRITQKADKHHQQLPAPSELSCSRSLRRPRACPLHHPSSTNSRFAGYPGSKGQSGGLLKFIIKLLVTMETTLFTATIHEKHIIL